LPVPKQMDHPRGIEPLGNSLLSDTIAVRDTGLGDLQPLTDDLVLELLGHLSAVDLAHLSTVSKSFYCFCSHEDLWKGLVLQDYEGRFKWHSTWKQTYGTTHSSTAAKQGPKAVQNGDSHTATDIAVMPAHTTPNHKDLQTSDSLAEVPRGKGKGKKKAGEAAATGGRKGSRKQEAAGQLQPGGPSPAVLRVRGFYSDLLYQPWFCATVDLDPSWLEVDNVERRSKLSMKDFIEQYERPNRPVVITDATKKWPAMKKWSNEYLSAAFEGQDIIAGNYPMPFSTYLSYSSSTRDELPLYLFDKGFCRRAPQLQEDFSVPPYFSEDLFSVLGEDSRPDYRWLIMGPQRSGSSFHVDPNATSAWNAVIRGSKKWILYPPHVVPPGVHPSADGADVATPLSLVEWFLNFYEETKEGKVRPVECIVREGELIFVPRGWWHLAINLEDSVAITQNYVSSATLPHVLSFLRSKRSDLVSGCAHQDRCSLYERFLAALREQRPALVEEWEAARAEKRRKVEADNRLAAMFKASAHHATAPAPAQAASVEKGSAAAAAATTSTAGAPAVGFSFGFVAGKGSAGGSQADAGAAGEHVADAPSNTSASFAFGFRV